VNGIAYARLMLLMGVLQKRCGMFWSRQDIYVNVVGRFRLDRGEGNAADLAIAVALASSLHSIAVRSDTAFVGEVGLLGELRSVQAVEKRLNEARRMGFSRVITPPDFQSKQKKVTRGKTYVTRLNGIEWIQCATLQAAINEGLVQHIPQRKQRARRKSTSDANIPDKMEDLGLEIFDDEVDEMDAFL
jgi:predicted ATP-dependent serine protease